MNKSKKGDIMLNEVNLLSKVNHPNIITYLGHFFDSSNGLHYMIMELAPCGNHNNNK